MGYNYMLGTNRRCNCPNRYPWYDNRGPYDRGLSPRWDRLDRYDRFDGRRRYDYDDYLKRHGGCCSHRRRSTSYRRSIFD